MLSLGFNREDIDEEEVDSEDELETLVGGGVKTLMIPKMLSWNSRGWGLKVG